MANPNTPFGLRAVRHLFGGVVRPNNYTIADQYGTSLFDGDPVLCTGTGKNIGIATAGASNKITGVFNGCEYVDSLGDTKFSKYWPASTVTKTGSTILAHVYDDPHILFEVQFNTLAAADVRALCNLVSGTGNTLTGTSGWTAVNPPGSTENQLKIYSISGQANPGGVENAYGAYCVGQVLIAQHEMAGTMVGV